MFVVAFAFCLLLGNSCEADDFGDGGTDSTPQIATQPLDAIVATVTGSLATVWDTGTLHYASATASGGEIQLDPVGCPAITRELLEFQRSQGGGFISAVQVRAKGQIVFEARPESASYRQQARDQPNAFIPVLRVRWIEITTLHVTQDAGPLQRKRDRVISTTVRLPKLSP